MEFREGMLGVVIVALALICALGVSYVAGVEPKETEVTKYDYLADVSGLFDYDRSPQYIEFDPSSNYVGYYSKDTGEYWPVDDVGYEESARVNNYRVNLAPELLESRTDYPIEGPDDSLLPHSAHYINYSTTQHDGYIFATTTEMALKDYLRSLDLGSGVGSVDLMSKGDNTNEIEGVHRVDWVLFTSKDMWGTRTAGSSVQDIIYLWSGEKFEASGEDPGYTDQSGRTYYRPCLSVKIDFGTNAVKLYYDSQCTVYSGLTYSISDMILSYTPGNDVLSPLLDDRLDYVAHQGGSGPDYGGDILPHGTHYINYSTTQHDGYIFAETTEISLRDYIRSMGLPAEMNQLYLKSNGDDTNDIDGIHRLNWVLFTTKDMWGTRQVLFDTQDIIYLWSGEKFDRMGVQPGYVDSAGHKIYRPCLSAQIDLVNGFVQLYYDNECTVYSGINIDLSSVILSFTENEEIVFSPLLDCTLKWDGYNNRREYLDPNFGVTMKDE